MRRGVRIGLDVGSVRIGVAVCDPDGIVATPAEALPAGAEAVAEVARLARAHAAIEVVVGLPLHLSGGAGASADLARAFAADLAAAVAPVRVALLDERLSTVQAQRRLREAGRPARAQRSAVDSASAAVILHHALETERGTGQPAGITVGRKARSRGRREQSEGR